LDFATRANLDSDHDHLPLDVAVDTLGIRLFGVALRSALGPPYAQRRRLCLLHHVPGRRRRYRL